MSIMASGEDVQYVTEEFYIPETQIARWEYFKGPKREKRVRADGFEYFYSEGGMAFPDSLDSPSRTIITSEGGKSPDRCRHVIEDQTGRYRRLIPLELERLNMFPDHHTALEGVDAGKRAFLMGNALVCGIVEIIGKSLYRAIYDEEPVSSNPISTKRDKQPVFKFDLFANEKIDLVVNAPKKTYTLDPTKHLLIGLVKLDNQDYFLNGTPTKIYYTGKTKAFPSTIALNKLYYFMPYIKGKGVKDLYLIRVARIGNKAEINKGSKDTDPRLVFELEYLDSLPEYKSVKLNIFNAFRDTILGSVYNYF